MTDESAEKPSLLTQGVKFGVLLAMINIIFTLMIYVIDISFMVKWWYQISILVLNIVLIVYAGIHYRKQNGNLLSFKDSFIFIFFVLIVSGLIGLGFRILLFNVIDPSLPENLTQATFDETIAMMEKFGLPDEQVDQALDDLEQERETIISNYQPWGIIKGFLWFILAYVVFALIIGAIIKKSKPEFEN